MSDGIKSECQEWNRTTEVDSTTVELVSVVVRNNLGDLWNLILIK